MNLKEFIESGEPNAWLDYGPLNVYARQARHVVDDILTATLDIASISVVESHRGQGLFTAFLEEAEKFPVTIYIENVLNERLRVFLHRRGYRVASTDAIGTPSYARDGLMSVGYWHSRYEPNLPKPQKAAWNMTVRDAVIAYLKAGKTKHSWMGWSSCRVCDAHNGTTCLSDGVWVWPAGLAHYVEEHNTGLPQLFIDYVVSVTLAKDVTLTLADFIQRYIRADHGGADPDLMERDIRESVAGQIAGAIDAEIVADIEAGIANLSPAHRHAYATKRVNPDYYGFVDVSTVFAPQTPVRRSREKYIVGFPGEDE
jgi:hypothetical protein